MFGGLSLQPGDLGVVVNVGGSMGVRDVIAVRWLKSANTTGVTSASLSPLVPAPLPEPAPNERLRPGHFVTLKRGAPLSGVLKKPAEGLIGIVVSDSGEADASAPFGILVLGRPVAGAVSVPNASGIAGQGAANIVSQYCRRHLVPRAPLPITRTAEPTFGAPAFQPGFGPGGFGAGRGGKLAVVTRPPAPTPGPPAAAAAPAPLPLDPRPGARVLRGPSWVAAVYGDQDGGAGALGTVVGLAPGGDVGWWTVRWDAGGAFSYRWMPHAGAFDLAMATAEDLAGTSAATAAHAVAAAVKQRAVGVDAAAASAPVPSAVAAAATAPRDELHPAVLEIGARVRRGRDWALGNKVSGVGATGDVVAISGTVVFVAWQAMSPAPRGTTFVRYNPADGALTLELIAPPPRCAAASSEASHLRVGDLVLMRAGAEAVLSDQAVGGPTGCCLGDPRASSSPGISRALGVVLEVCPDGRARVKRTWPRPTQLKTKVDRPALLALSVAEAATVTPHASAEAPENSLTAAAGAILPQSAGAGDDEDDRMGFSRDGDDDVDLDDQRPLSASERDAAVTAETAVASGIGAYYARFPVESTLPSVVLEVANSALPLDSGGKKWLPGEGLTVGCRVKAVPLSNLGPSLSQARSGYMRQIASNPEKIFTLAKLDSGRGQRGGDGQPYVNLEEIPGFHWESSSLVRVGGCDGVDWEEADDRALITEAARRRTYVAGLCGARGLRRP